MPTLLVGIFFFLLLKNRFIFVAAASATTDDTIEIRAFTLISYLNSFFSNLSLRVLCHLWFVLVYIEIRNRKKHFAKSQLNVDCVCVFFLVFVSAVLLLLLLFLGSFHVYFIIFTCFIQLSAFSIHNNALNYYRLTEHHLS